MPMFGRAARRRLPAETLTQLEQLGRSQYDPGSCDSPWQFVSSMYQLAQDDREGFLADLAALVVPVGGWPAYGGLRLLWEIFSADLSQPDFDAIALTGLQFLRSHGVPSSRVSPYELAIWHRLQGDNTPWLIGRPPPADRLTPLKWGDVRKVAQVFPGPSSNLILVRQDAPERYVAVIDGQWSEEDPRRVQNEWYSAETLHELYLRIGDAFQVPCYWADPELEPYFPLPPPTI
jgi:hypothetical protein